jgi:hypothetical protein
MFNLQEAIAEAAAGATTAGTGVTVRVPAGTWDVPATVTCGFLPLTLVGCDSPKRAAVLRFTAAASPGIVVDGPSPLLVRGLTLERIVAAVPIVEIRGPGCSAALSDCNVRGTVSVGERGSATLTRCSVSVASGASGTNAVQANGRGSSVSARDCVITSVCGAGVAFTDGAGGEWRGCTIEACAHACLALGGEGTDPSFVDCTVRGGQSSGVFVFDSAGGAFERCVVMGSRLAGV